MKYFLPILAILLATSCTKQEVEQPQEEPQKNCAQTTTATVQYMKVTETGEEDFYYLVVKDPVSGEDLIVYPSSLREEYKVEGTQIEIAFGLSGKIHEYIICLAGHIHDPENPHVYTMPIADICASKPVSS